MQVVCTCFLSNRPKWSIHVLWLNIIKPIKLSYQQSRLSFNILCSEKHHTNNLSIFTKIKFNWWFNLVCNQVLFQAKQEINVSTQTHVEDLFFCAPYTRWKKNVGVLTARSHENLLPEKPGCFKHFCLYLRREKCM